MALSTLTLADFLLARIAEDEAGLSGVTQPVRISEKVVTTGRERVRVSGYVFDPERARAECEAKRRIIGVWVAQWSTPEDGFPSRPLGGQGGEVYYDVLWYLATVYADHPDFREEWRP